MSLASSSLLRHSERCLDPQERFEVPAPLGVPAKDGGQNSISSIHAIHGQHRHVGGRWKSKFNHNEQEVGVLRRKLENLERSGGGGAEEAWFVRRRLIGVYNANALPLLRGSGFVEAFHLLQAALELSLYASEGGCLCVAERGMGAPPARGTRLSALTLNNLGVYHRRRGQGRSALKCLHRAEKIEGDDPAVSTQINLAVLCAELGMLRASLAHVKAALRRTADEVSGGMRQPAERSAAIAVAVYNLGIAMQENEVGASTDGCLTHALLRHHSDFLQLANAQRHDRASPPILFEICLVSAYCGASPLVALRLSLCSALILTGASKPQWRLRAGTSVQTIP